MEYDRFLIKEEGYTFVNDLLEADAEELHDLIDDAEREAGMKIPEGRRLLKAIERGVRTRMDVTAVDETLVTVERPVAEQYQTLAGEP